MGQDSRALRAEPHRSRSYNSTGDYIAILWHCRAGADPGSRAIGVAGLVVAVMKHLKGTLIDRCATAHLAHTTLRKAPSKRGVDGALYAIVMVMLFLAYAVFT